jgi:2-amino-4-hydroxy-6-hydroxymethyldihydropteridine diphosphokinase
MILIALGANLSGRHGTPEQTLAAARARMAECGLRAVQCSSTWLTAPVPVSDQPWYRNEVVAVETDRSPYAILETLQIIEQEFGRVRTVRNAPRVLDLDLIAYDDLILDKPELIVPHPRMHRRAFVLMPLQEIAPDWRHPLLNLPLASLIRALPAEQEAVKARTADAA